ncbi:hypothetical protein GCM10020218_074710 [Dactylosporangium vinaceum]
MAGGGATVPPVVDVDVGAGDVDVDADAVDVADGFVDALGDGLVGGLTDALAVGLGFGLPPPHQCPRVLASAVPIPAPTAMATAAVTARPSMMRLRFPGNGMQRLLGVRSVGVGSAS